MKFCAGLVDAKNLWLNIYGICWCIPNIWMKYYSCQVVPAWVPGACQVVPGAPVVQVGLNENEHYRQVFTWFCGVMNQSRQKKSQVPIITARVQGDMKGCFVQILFGINTKHGRRRLLDKELKLGWISIILTWHDMSYTSQKAFVSIKAISGQKTSAQPSKCHRPF